MQYTVSWPPTYHGPGAFSLAHRSTRSPRYEFIPGILPPTLWAGCAVRPTPARPRSKGRAKIGCERVPRLQGNEQDEERFPAINVYVESHQDPDSGEWEPWIGS